LYFSTGFHELNSLLGGGYNEKSTVLIIGPTGVGKEILLYNFILSGIREDDACLYVTRQLVNDVQRDSGARGINLVSNSLTWIAPGGSEKKFSPENLAKLSFAVKDYLKESGEKKKTRIVLDPLSSLLLTNSADSVYRFLTQLFAEVKIYDTCILAILEEDMHTPSVIASMEQIFDGVLRIGSGEDESLQVEVRKMIGSNIPSRQKISISLRSVGEESKWEPGEASGRKRIAVLPLVSFSPDPNDEFFADGLTEELIDRLCQVRELEVIARTSVMAYKNKEKKIAEIGKELRVGTLVEGSVRKAGNKIRVTAQLIDAKTEGHLWSSRYDNELQDIFAVQSDIAEKITEALKLNLIGAEKERIRRKTTSVSEAYIAYLNAVYFRYKASSEGLTKAAQYSSKAIELDPNYAEAYAQLAVDHIFLGIYWGEPVVQAFSKAAEFAAKALTLAPNLSEAHYAKSWVSYFYEMNWEVAERESKIAIELKPSYAEPRNSLAWILLGLGRSDEALSEARKAVDLDPLGVYSILVLAHVLSTIGRFDESILWHKKAIEMAGTPFFHCELGYTYLQMGKVTEGAKEMERAAKLTDGEYFKASLAYGYAVSGRREDALKIASEIETLRSKGMEFARPYEIAIIYAGLGENSKSLDLLEEAYREHSIVHLRLLTYEPAFANLRLEPRFKSLLQKMNLKA
jgi:TolB-like protein/KaiC/GvpD/RAD55 family RecA-like ATPase